MATPRPIALSHSTLEKAGCLYLLKRLKADPYKQRLKEPKGEPAMFGGLFHHITALYHETAWAAASAKKRKLPFYDEALMGQVFEETWADRPAEFRSLPEGRRDDMEQLCLRMPEWFPLGPTFEGVELKLALDHDWNKCDWMDSRVFYRMIIDRVDLSGHTVILRDWKSSYRTDTQAETEKSPQMMGYAMGAFAVLPEAERVEIEVVFPRSRIIRTAVVDRNDADKAKARILRESSRIENARANNDWPATPGSLCAFCPAFHECPAKDFAGEHRAPESSDEASEHLGVLELQKRVVKVLDSQLKSYVRMYGPVRNEQLLAQFKPQAGQDVDVAKLIDWTAENIGILPEEILSPNKAALKRWAKRNPDFGRFLETITTEGKATERWSVGKDKDGDEN